MPTIQDMNASTMPMPEGYGLAATTVQDKTTTLEQKRQEKIAYLGANKQYANLDESMTVMPGGNLESNRNKVWNNMDAVGVQDMLSDAADQSLTRDPNTGKVYYNKTGQEYTGELERAYMYGTKANDGSVKFGLARGDLPSSDYRYQPGRAAKEGYNVGKNGYGWDAGPDGVDTSKNYMDMLLPKNVAIALEGAIHGNSNALANRKYPDYLSDESLQHASGVSEYYKSAEGMLGDTSKLTAEQIKQGDTSNLAGYSQLQGAQGKQYAGKRQALTDEQWNRILGKEDVPEYNIARGMGSATLNVGAKVASLIGEGAESAGQVLGVKGLEGAGTAAQEAATKFQMESIADKMTGYDSKNAQELQAEIGETIKKDGYLAALGKAVTDSRSLEVLATSVPEMVALAASVGTMAIANANNNINIGEKAAGREFTAEEKALSAVTSIVSTYLDRAGDKLALGGMNGAKQALKAAVEKAPASVQEALVSKWGKGILTIGEAPLRLAGAGAVEGGTEYLQTLGEKAAQDPEVFKAGFNEKALDEADVAGVLGAAMGTHMATPKVVKDMLVGGSDELSPQQKEVLERPEQAKASKDEFFAKVQKAKEDLLDESHYRNRGELKNIATEFMSGSDKSGILASDDDTHTKLEKVKELVAMVAEDGELTAEHKQKLVERLTDQLGMDSKHIEASVQEAEDTGNALRVLKTAKDVDNEVTTGPRGFVTYYNNAVTAMQNGDKETLAKNIENLGKFIQSQETKRGRLAGAEEEVLKEYNAKVQMLMDAEGLNEAAAGKKVYQEWAKDRNNGRGYVSVAYSDAKGVKPFELFKSQVIENKVAEANGKEYEFGGYAAIKGIERSIEAMKQLYGQLEGNASVREGVPEVTKKWVDEKIASGVKPEQLAAGIQASDKLTANQKAAAVGYIKESKGEEVPTPREAAEVPLDEEASKEPEGNFTTQDESGTSFEDVEGDFTTPDDTDIDMNFEEPDMDFTTPDDVNMNFEEPNEEYVGMDEVNQVFGEPEEGNFTTDDVVTRNPGEKRSKKDVIELKGDSKLVAENREILDTLRRKLDKLRAEGKSESAEAKKAKGLVEKLQVTMDRLIAGSPLHKLLNEPRSTMSSTAKNLREVFTVGKATPLNAEVVKANEEAVKLIDEVIKKPTLAGKVVHKQDSFDDPGRALLFNNDGSVNGNVATALWKAMNDYVATSAGALANGKTFEQVGKMFPNLEVEATIDMLVHLNEGGDLLKFEAEKVGADVMKLLGIVPSKKEVSSVEVQGMKASLGMMTIRMAEGKGLVKIGSVNPYGGDATIPMLYIGKEFKNGLDNVLDESEKYASYDTPDVPKKSYSFNKIVRDDVEVHNQPYTDVTPLQKAMKQELDQLAFKVNSGAEVLLEMYGDNPEALKDALGRTSDEDLEKMSYDGKKAAESVNREIETKVDGFFEMLKDAKEDDGYKTMFFEWFVTKGGRTNSYATVVDPQSDKQLARWLVTTEGSRKELTREDIDENTDAGVGFKYGLVQAFDGVLPEKVEIDKSSRAKVIDMADRLLTMSDEELKGMVEGSEHLGHALLGLANIRKARATKFESDLVMEMDGLTNGLSFKFMQFPTSDIMELLPKVGVVLEGTKEFAAETIAEVKDKDKKFGEFADLYETVGTKLEVPVLKDTNAKLQELLKDVLPKLNDLKVVRNLAKPMVMVTGYNAGETSTKLAQVNELIGKLVEDIVSGKVENVGELEKLVKVTNLKGLLKKNSVVDPKLKPFREAMTKFYMEAYAEPMYKALADTIPGLVKVGSAVTSAYEYMYQVLVQEYDKKVAEFKQAPGQEQKVEIMRELLEKCGPIVRNSETVGKLDRVLALSRELVDMKEKINSNKGTEGAKNVQLVVRTFGKPGAAGGVLQTHTEDNHTMARAMMDASKKFNQVFDAMVLGVDQWSEVKGYNRNFYELNKEFSMLDAVIEALEMNMKLDEGGKIKVGTKGDVSGQNLLDSLKQFKTEIDGNRAKIFGSRAKVGQMVGTNGTMHEVNPKEELARIEDMKAKMKESLEGLGKGESLLDKKLLEIAKKMECK